MRPVTVLVLGVLLLFLFGAFIVQFVVLGDPAPATTSTDALGLVGRTVAAALPGARS
jgi:hypothetical protein